MQQNMWASIIVIKTENRFSSLSPLWMECACERFVCLQLVIASIDEVETRRTWTEKPLGPHFQLLSFHLLRSSNKIEDKALEN